ncbi:MAG TPA: Sec-independent protein translocase protein TatB [Stellaceae bacterium]
MFDFSWSEILLIGVVALVVIGPKDLPRVLRTVGQWTNRARSVAREFQFQIDQMVRDSELDDVRKSMSAVVGGGPSKIIRNFIDPSGDLEKSLSAPEFRGETPPAPAEPAVEPAPVEPTQLALPTIGAPVPAFLQPVLGFEAPEAAPVPMSEPPAAPPRDHAEAAPAEPKSGTHG